jgi:hypothetical protein
LPLAADLRKTPLAAFVGSSVGFERPVLSAELCICLDLMVPVTSDCGRVHRVIHCLPLIGFTTGLHSAVAIECIPRG